MINSPITQSWHWKNSSAFRTRRPFWILSLHSKLRYLIWSQLVLEAVSRWLGLGYKDLTTHHRSHCFFSAKCSCFCCDNTTKLKDLLKFQQRWVDLILSESLSNFLSHAPMKDVMRRKGNEERVKNNNNASKKKEWCETNAFFPQLW